MLGKQETRAASRKRKAEAGSGRVARRLSADEMVPEVVTMDPVARRGALPVSRGARWSGAKMVPVVRSTPSKTG